MPVSKKVSRSTKRMKEFWSNRKKLNKYVVAAILEPQHDNRPFVKILIIGKEIVSLLDSGANKSCIGGELSQTFLKSPESYGVSKFVGNVRTADGKRQQVVGSITQPVRFNEKHLAMEFL